MFFWTSKYNILSLPTIQFPTELQNTLSYTATWLMAALETPTFHEWHLQVLNCLLDLSNLLQLWGGGIWLCHPHFQQFFTYFTFSCLPICFEKEVFWSFLWTRNPKRCGKMDNQAKHPTAFFFRPRILTPPVEILSQTGMTSISESTPYLLLDVSPAACKAFCNFSAVTKFKSFPTYYQFKIFHNNYKLQIIGFFFSVISIYSISI